jgi:hypothetical protein
VFQAAHCAAYPWRLCELIFFVGAAFVLKLWFIRRMAECYVEHEGWGREEC